MQRCFSSAKPLRNLSSQELYIRDLLRQQVVGCICCLPWQSPKAVTALYEMNGRIGLVHVIESDPQGHSPRLRQRPEARILVPGLGGRIPGQLAKEVSAPAAELWPQDVLDEGQNPGASRHLLHQGLMQWATQGMCCTESGLIIGRPVCALCQHVVEVSPGTGQILTIQDWQAQQEATVAVGLQLSKCQRMTFSGVFTQILPCKGDIAKCVQLQHLQLLRVIPHPRSFWQQVNHLAWP
mmetsp:Transcript_18915/g.44400  ORF Transcript_18915/g.44400 Transcript_18915/m.44400 type:complete len:238 (+) Transcript_18915:297-1010(+)